LLSFKEVGWNKSSDIEPELIDIDSDGVIEQSVSKALMDRGLPQLEINVPCSPCALFRGGSVSFY
jgi:hypothetical protein